MKVKKIQKLPKLLLIVASSFIISGNSPITPVNSRPLIIIDPGHGGKDKGAISLNGIPEKDLNLMLAIAIKNRLNKYFKVIMTRNSDYFVSNISRSIIGNKQKPSLFISIHYNSLFSMKSKELSIGVYSYRMQKDIKTTSTAGSMQEKYSQESKILAEKIAKKYKDCPVYRMPYSILSNIDCPAILLEFKNLKSPKDCLNLASRQDIENTANKITDIINKFFLNFSLVF